MDSEYPAWICEECGDRYGRWPEGHLSTWHKGDKCGWCGSTDKPVTEPRDFRYPAWPPKKEESRDEHTI